MEDTPGTTYMYNNGNTIMLSYFLEKYSGLNVAEYVRQKIFQPLGLLSTSQDALSQQLSANPSMSHEYYDYTDLTKSYDYFAYGNGAATEVQSGTQTGAGGFLSTAGDMVKFYSSLFSSKNASSVISDENLALMVTPLSLTQYNDVYGCEYFGLGMFMVYRYPCTPADVTTRMYVYYQGKTRRLLEFTYSMTMTMQQE
jgi:CubicO group peptidase (beta-lactamase class C family)